MGKFYAMTEAAKSGNLIKLKIETNRILGSVDGDLRQWPLVKSSLNHILEAVDQKQPSEKLTALLYEGILNAVIDGSDRPISYPEMN